MLDHLIVAFAQEISRKHGLKPSDASHVATAIFYKCQSLQTYDGERGEAKKLFAFKGKIGTPALTIDLPRKFEENLQGTLSFGT
jgi:hypothetical protein